MILKIIESNYIPIGYTQIIYRDISESTSSNGTVFFHESDSTFSMSLEREYPLEVGEIYEITLTREVHTNLVKDIKKIM